MAEHLSALNVTGLRTEIPEKGISVSKNITITEVEKEIVEEQFDRYVKKVVSNYSWNEAREYLKTCDPGDAVSFEALGESIPAPEAKKEGDTLDVELGGVVICLSNDLLIEALNNLSSKDREIIGMAVILGKSNSSIGREKDWEMQTVKNYKLGALASLRNMYEEAQHGKKKK